MAFYDGSGSNGLAVVVDARSKHCMETGEVLRDWALGRRALGRTEWARTLKVALREHGTDPWTSKQVKGEKDAVVGTLLGRGISVVVPVQSPSTPGVRQVHSAWNMFGHPGSPYKWAGTVQQSPPFYVAPILHPGNYEYVYGWLLERWLRQAHQVAAGQLRPLPWPELCWMPGQKMYRKLLAIFNAKRPVAIDIETNMAGTLITAIGFANGEGTVSVPWDSYEIAGTNGQREMGLLDYGFGHHIQRLAINILESGEQPKILHNGAFDVVQLKKHGITLRGFEHDTLLLHRVCYPQYRHGLQQACATEFVVEPWKCLFKPPRVKPDEDHWLGCPVELRQYNCKDSYATWKLWQSLERKLG